MSSSSPDPSEKQKSESQTLRTQLHPFQRKNLAKSGPPKRHRCSSKAVIECVIHRNELEAKSDLCQHQHGVGNWKTILSDCSLEFDSRSSVDLKDRSALFFPRSILVELWSFLPAFVHTSRMRTRNITQTPAHIFLPRFVPPCPTGLHSLERPAASADGLSLRRKIKPSRPVTRNMGLSGRQLSRILYSKSRTAVRLTFETASEMRILIYTKLQDTNRGTIKRNST